MSDHHSKAHAGKHGTHAVHGGDDTHEVHEGPIRTPKQLVLAVFFAFLIPILAIILLANYVNLDKRTGAGTKAMEDQAVAARLMPVGRVEVKDASDVNALKSGEEVYKAQCMACHATGAAGAPKLGDAAAWGPRLGAGYAGLLNSALKGKGSMGAQGGGDFTDLEIGRAVVYMANAGGGKLAEPAVGGAAAAASAPAAEAASAPVAAVRTDAYTEASAGLVKLYFASGKSALPGDAQAALGELAKEIKTGDKMAVISGFHDGKGNAAVNGELAKKRAFAARDVLLAAGVAKEKIELKKPENAVGEGSNAQARRVEVAVK